ncbi:MAG: type III pantothenate kinase [Alphaproteobacteria bacterium]|nr:type III pantothenate kinase [Alphaproteobacteria bacterium]
MNGDRLLAIDAGNTNTVFAVFEGDTIRGRWRVATRTDRTADEYAAMIAQLMGLAGLTPDHIREVIISSVVPPGLFALRMLARHYFSCEPMIVGQGVKLGIQVLVDRPAEVGADRLVNAIAGHVAYGGPLVIVDFGTATTLDVIDRDGNYRGGIIAPGVNLALEALHQAAASLPRIAVERPPSVIGKSTVPAMQSGIFWGYVSLIEGLVARIKGELDSPHSIKVIATGGLAPLFESATDAIQHVDADLTIKGLREIHRRNRAAGA